jgi:hypothetical protein
MKTSRVLTHGVDICVLRSRGTSKASHVFSRERMLKVMLLIHFLSLKPFNEATTGQQGGSSRYWNSRISGFPLLKFPKA